MEFSEIPFKFQIMEVAVLIIYYIPYNGINLNWTAITGNNGILMEFFRSHGILMEICWNYFDYFYSFGFILKTYFIDMLFPSQGRSIDVLKRKPNDKL